MFVGELIAEVRNDPYGDMPETPPNQGFTW